MKLSPDGILVVDPTARIISVNRRFGQIFDIPSELLAAGDDGPVRARSDKRMADEETFQRRVKYLYDHPRNPVRTIWFLRTVAGSVVHASGAVSTYLAERRHRYRLGLSAERLPQVG